ncbi:MAG TPA: type II secretion system protein [Nitrospirota bacterium]
MVVKRGGVMCGNKRLSSLSAPESGGYTYIGLLMVIVIIGIMTTVVAQTWKSVARVQKEKELIWIGHQFRTALKGYYDYRKGLHGGNPGAFYPSDVKDLLKDPGRPADHAYLRKIYTDPVTGKDDWVYIMGGGTGGSGIIGVRSASDKATLKRDGFDKADENFKGKTKYSEWEFKFVPVVTPGAAPPATPPPVP